ncbi:MAG: hypothetical protein UFM30_03505 [Bacteroidales bacterium]|nr:hypothetical protein [Bacteroidales bacterium]
MSNNTDVIRTFVKRAALYIAEVKSLSIEDALSYVYNSDTFRILDEKQHVDMDVHQLLDTFKQELVSGKVE